METKLNDFKSILEDLNNKLDIKTKEARLNELDSIVSNPNFWGESNTKDVLEEQKNLRVIVNNYNEINDSVNTLIEMLTLELTDEDKNSFEKEINIIEKKLDELKLSTFLSGEYDSSNAYIEIHSGAGGTESNDWANMLYRMYSRFCSINKKI